MRSRRETWSIFAGAILVVLCGCRPERPGPSGETDEPGQRTRDERPRLGFGVIPGVDPGLTYNGYQPLIDHLTNRTPFLFRLSLGRDTDDLLRNVEERMVEVVPLGAVSYLEAHHQFGAVPLVKPLNREGKSVSYCVFVVREASPIKSLSDLKGSALALGSFHSTTSNLIARYELMRTGVELDELAAIEHFDDDDTVAAAVLEGRFEAGAVGDGVANRLRGKGLRAIHVSEPVPSAPLVVRGDLPPAVFDSIRNALLEVDPREAGERESWDENVRYGFTLASDADYDVVRRMAARVGGACGGSCHSDVSF